MSNIVVFGATQSGKTTLMGYLTTAMYRHPQFNDEILEKLKLIRRLTANDEFHIGNPYNPVNVKKDVILPSFVSLDRDELRKFLDGEASEGTTKRIHRKQLTICVSERNDVTTIQNENRNIPCIFIDIPGFRQRISDKYRGFYEGDIGIAVLKLSELLQLWKLINDDQSSQGQNADIQERLERRLFEPIRIWCDYRNPARLVIAISQIDRDLDGNIDSDQAWNERSIRINRAIECVRLYTDMFGKRLRDPIPIAPISIRLTSEENYKKHHRMSVFFKRVEENIYSSPQNGKKLGDGTLINCLKFVMSDQDSGQLRQFSMASVYRPMRAMVNNSPRTVLSVRALHGSIEKYKEDKKKEYNHVLLGPVLNKNGNNIIYADCTMSSLKSDGTEVPSDYLLEGNVGGIIFNSIRDIESGDELILHHNAKESQLLILKSTILYTGEIACGDIIVLEMRKEDYVNVNGFVDEIYTELLSSLMPFDQLVLFWFGKRISVNIVELQFTDSRSIRISVIVSKIERRLTPYFALPCKDKGDKTLKHSENVLLAIAHSSKYCRHEIYTYVNASVVSLKCSADYNCIEIKASQDMELQYVFQDSVSFSQAHNNGSIEEFIIPIQNPNRTIDVYSVLTKISRNVKSNFGRTIYHMLGGINMKLVRKTTVSDVSGTPE